MTDAIRKAAQDVLDGWDDKAVLSITDEMEVLRTALATPTQAAPVRSDLIDDDGENKAVRAFLSLYQNGATSVRKMVVHMAHLGWGNNPTWVTEALDEPLTKAGAQLWIRHLLALENAPAAPDTCPDCGKPAPEGSIHTCSPQKPDSDAKQRLLEIMRKNGLATGHGDTIDDALKELDWQLSELKGKSDGTL